MRKITQQYLRKHVTQPVVGDHLHLLLIVHIFTKNGHQCKGDVRDLRIQYRIYWNYNNSSIQLSIFLSYMINTPSYFQWPAVICVLHLCTQSLGVNETKKRQMRTFIISQVCEVETHRAVVLQWCFQVLELGCQRVMALGHQHDAIKATNKEIPSFDTAHCSDTQNPVQTPWKLKRKRHISLNTYFWFLRSVVHSTGWTLDRKPREETQSYYFLLFKQSQHCLTR